MSLVDLETIKLFIFLGLLLCTRTQVVWLKIFDIMKVILLLYFGLKIFLL